MHLDELNLVEVYRYYQKAVEGGNRKKANEIWEYLLNNYPHYFNN